jgi:ribonuclease P protein component
MRRSSDFSSVVRSGMRVRRASLVLHQLVIPKLGGQPASGVGLSQPDPIVGFVVGKSVGNSVVRHRVSRRLRAQIAARIDQLPLDSATVVRALPPAAGADSAQLGADLDSALRRLSQSAPPAKGRSGARPTTRSAGGAR